MKNLDQILKSSASGPVLNMKKNYLEKPNFEIIDETHKGKPVTWNIKSQLRILQGESDGFPSDSEGELASEKEEKSKPFKLNWKASEIFDGDGNAVKKLPDEKKFNLVFDNSQYKLD